ncbi:TrbI/VirB10 family protein, partial [Parashewanella curva]
LETAISSDVAGMTRCQLSRDIYSTNGKVLLLEKGSHIVGEYQAGLEQGQARIFVLWDRIETPTGVILDLASPGTDNLGRSGHSGYVDGHFGQRFGSAMLLSLIGDVGTYYANKSKGNSNKIQFGDTIGGTKDLASIALQDSIHIKPTLYKNQGEHINVFVARDLDFRSVYELKLSQ